VIDKAALRTAIKAGRTAMSERERTASRTAIREHLLAWLASTPTSPGSRIAAYEPLRTEPGSVELLAALSNAGYEVIVPETLPDNDLDWALWADGERDLLGCEAVATASLVLVPAFAVDSAGRRLGRGGGSYDRALARVPDGTTIAALVFAAEFLAEIPVDPWDRPVSAVVTPSGFIGLWNT